MAVTPFERRKVYRKRKRDGVEMLVIDGLRSIKAGDVFRVEPIDDADSKHDCDWGWRRACEDAEFMDGTGWVVTSERAD